MSRKSRSFRSGGPNLRPVQKIELSDTNIKRRIILVALLFVISLVSLGYGFSQLFTINQGWQDIQASSSQINSGDDFVLTYKLGSGDKSATAEKKALTLVYTELCENSYNDFCNDEEIEGVNNIYYINNHPNEEIVVSDLLYSSFEKLALADNRLIYLAPIYEVYDDMFACGDDSQAVEFDPYENATIQSFYQEVSDYAKDSDAINVQLLGDNKIKLVVSKKYQDYVEKECISSYIDFFWMKNAFICDYMADGLIEAGYSQGTLSSFDGFYRCLDSTDTEYSYNVMARLSNDTNTYAAAIMKYSGQTAMVYMKDYISSNMDKRFFYKYRDGHIRNSYIDIEDGRCKNAVSGLLAYSKSQKCADILMELIPIYIADQFDSDKLDEISKNGIYSVYNVETSLYCTDKNIQLEEKYDKDGISFN